MRKRIKKRIKKNKRHMVAFDKPTLWEAIRIATIAYNMKYHKYITMAAWIRLMVEKAAKRTSRKGK